MARVKTVGRARPPLPHHVGLEESRERLPVERHPAHHRERREQQHPPGAGEETARHRIGNEAKEVRETKVPDREEQQPRQQAGQEQQCHHGHELDVARRTDRTAHGGADRAEHRRGNLLRNGEHARVAARHTNQKAEDDASEQHHSGALYSVRQHRPAEDDRGKSNAVNDDHRPHEPADGQRPKQLRRLQVGAKSGQRIHGHSAADGS